MELVFDTETYLLAPGNMAPKPVVVSYCIDDDPPRLRTPEDFIPLFVGAVRKGAIFIGHNVAYDFKVLMAHYPEIAPYVWQLYREQRVRDTMVREKLLKLSEGRLTFDYKLNRTPAFRMDSIAAERLGLDLTKEKTAEDAWRYRYSELDGVSLDQWPDAATRYALDDAAHTRAIFRDQLKDARRPTPDGRARLDGSAIIDEVNQVLHSFTLGLVSTWGIKTDPEAVANLSDRLTVEVEEKKLKLKHFFRNKGSMNTFAVQDAVRAAYEKMGKEVPLTDTGKVSRKSSVLEDSEDPELQLLAEYLKDMKELSTYIPILQKGTVLPLHPGYNSLLETGRTSSFGPNIQNQPRRHGVRECYVPRPGWIFVGADYASLELAALAQVLLDLFGESEMADAINDGRDLHLWMAANIEGISYEEAQRLLKAGDKSVKHSRQLAKVANFGFPGGLGPKTLVQYARDTYGVRITEEAARGLREVWYRTFPEIRNYFEFVSRATSAERKAEVAQLRSGRIRGGCSYTQMCNTLFQGLAADGAKMALSNVVHECYAVPESPLFGGRGGAFVHDEIILEVPEGRGPAAAKRLSEIMVESMKQYIPNIVITAEPVLMRRWYKDAEPVYGKDGELLPWEP